MEADPLTEQIDTEMDALEDTLKGRLQETMDLSDLSKDVSKSSMKLDEHTAVLEDTSRKVKWKWFFEYIKWMAIAGSIIILLLLAVLLPFLRLL
ncbi:hypothetical protein PAPHI01_0878 [Pancytospora philotis]|nr:hypothetical protein PAPHI01_0878 [Pancytospora philotis]